MPDTFSKTNAKAVSVFVYAGRRVSALGMHPLRGFPAGPNLAHALIMPKPALNDLSLDGNPNRRWSRESPKVPPARCHSPRPGTAALPALRVADRSRWTLNQHQIIQACPSEGARRPHRSPF